MSELYCTLNVCVFGGGGGVDGHIFIIPLVFTVLEFSIKHLSTGFLSNLISLYMYIRDVRYERIPVSVYRKKYTGNTGILVL